MADNISRQPLHTQVRSSILRLAKDGELGPKDKLPPEDTLARRFNVSRGTIRRAIQSLDHDGLVRTIHGVGTFLALSASKLDMLRLDKVKGFYRLIEDIGYEAKIVELGIIPDYSNPDIAERLNHSQDTIFRIIRRLLLANGTPSIYLRDHMPATLLKRELDPNSLPNSIFMVADEYCLQSIEHTISTIVPTTADEDVSSVLKVPLNHPILMLEETHYNDNDEPIMYSHVYVNDKIFRFSVYRTRH